MRPYAPAPDPAPHRGPRPRPARARRLRAGQAPARGAAARRPSRSSPAITSRRSSSTRVPALAVYVGARVRGDVRPLPLPLPDPRAARAGGGRAGDRARLRPPLHAGRAARLRVLRAAALHDAGARGADRAPSRQRVPAAPAHAAPLLRVGRGARRDPARAAGARRADGLGRDVALPRHRPLRLAGLRLRPRAARVAARGARRASSPRSRARSSTRRATSSCARGSPCSARWATPAPTCTATSRPGTTATPSSSGRCERDGEPHYRFPPAAAYRLNRCLYAIKSDPAFCARFLANPAAAMDELGLGPKSARRSCPSTATRSSAAARIRIWSSWPTSGSGWRASPARSRYF